MKKILFVVFLLSFATATTILSQTTQQDQQTNLFDFNGLSTFAAFAGCVLVLTSLVNKLFKLTGALKQYLSWGVAVIVGYAGFFLKLGIFAGVHWYTVLLYSLLFGLGANGLFDWELIRKILFALKLENTVP